MASHIGGCREIRASARVLGQNSSARGRHIAGAEFVRQAAGHGRTSKRLRASAERQVAKSPRRPSIPRRQVAAAAPLRSPVRKQTGRYGTNQNGGGSDADRRGANDRDLTLLAWRSPRHPHRAVTVHDGGRNRTEKRCQSCRAEPWGEGQNARHRLDRAHNRRAAHMLPAASAAAAVLWRTRAFESSCENAFASEIRNLRIRPVVECTSAAENNAMYSGRKSDFLPHAFGGRSR